ncbi:MAG: hypothetical protein AB1744_04495, partial [Candidatus Zixiibacteriota bacterium]
SWRRYGSRSSERRHTRNLFSDSQKAGKRESTRSALTSGETGKPFVSQPVMPENYVEFFCCFQQPARIALAVF